MSSSPDIVGQFQVSNFLAGLRRGLLDPRDNWGKRHKGVHAGVRGCLNEKRSLKMKDRL